ncbi:MAG: hypothetical protein ACOX5R_09780 [bacterium]|jgi:hypothetical protein
MFLPYDQDLETSEAIEEWLKDLGIQLETIECSGYPPRPLIFSKYQPHPPAIVLYRYPLMEDWLNLVSQQYAGYYGPWYYLHIVHRLYYHLELNGLYELERRWYHYLFGSLATLEDRAYHFTKLTLGTLHNPRKFDEMVEKSFQPGKI